MPEIISRKEAKARGLKYYFTGEPCKQGHVSVRLVGRRSCPACAKDLGRAWRKENPEKTKGYDRKYRDRNPEMYREKVRRWRSKNFDHESQYRKDRYRKQRAAYLILKEMGIEF